MFMFEKWAKWINVELNTSKAKSKSISKRDSIKNPKHGKDEFGGWKAHR